MVTREIFWLVALLRLLPSLLVWLSQRGGLCLILLLGPIFECTWWTCKVTQPVQCTPLWPASWLLAVDKGGVSKSVEVQRVWEIHDDWLQFMAGFDAVSLDESLGAGDVSCLARVVFCCGNCTC